MANEIIRQGYKLLTEEPIPIETVEDEHEESRDFQPSFWYWNRRYYLDDFTRTHNNPWIGGEFPDFIHGMENNKYHDPLFIELIGDQAVNVYKEAAK